MQQCTECNRLTQLHQQLFIPDCGHTICKICYTTIQKWVYQNKSNSVCLYHNCNEIRTTIKKIQGNNKLSHAPSLDYNLIRGRFNNSRYKDKLKSKKKEPQNNQEQNKQQTKMNQLQEMIQKLKLQKQLLQQRVTQLEQELQQFAPTPIMNSSLKKKYILLVKQNCDLRRQNQELKKEKQKEKEKSKEKQYEI